jgi:hypothetical protein
MSGFYIGMNDIPCHLKKFVSRDETKDEIVKYNIINDDKSYDNIEKEFEDILQRPILK